MTEGKKASKEGAAEASTDEMSPLVLSQIFADPQGLLDTRYASLDEIKDDCLVVLDANVLLMPYLMGQVSLAKAVAVYGPLVEAKRLIIPAQAAREFAKHRSRKIADVVQHLQEQSSRVVSPLTKPIGFLADDEDYEAAKVISEEIGKLAKDLQKRVRGMVSRIASDLGNEPVSNSYRNLFKGCVRDVDEPQDPSAFEKDLRERYAARRPPGYKDGKKPDAGSGDLLIWHTILRASAEEKRSCIFVTADEKADWYLQSSGAFQPRLELVEEFRLATSGGTLHIIPLSRLLELYGAEENVVAEARRAESAASKPNRTAAGDQARLNAFEDQWLDLLKELDDVQDQLVRTRSAMENVSADPINPSPSFPWTRAAHGLRLEERELLQRRDQIRRRLVEIEGGVEPS